MLGKPTIIRNDYTRLAGTPQEGSTGIQRLYLGQNHLLILQLKSNREVARRFYYSDITALRCVPNRWGYLFDGAFVVAALLLWLGYLASPAAGSGTLVAAVTVTVMALVVLTVNGLRGPTCKSWLHTANHTERLTNLGRYNTARRAMAELHERITASQGALEAAPDGAVRPPFAPYAPPPPPPRNAALRRHDRRPMAALFYLAFGVAALSLLRFVYEPGWVTTLTYWTFLCLTVLGVESVVRSYDTDCPSTARRMAFAILAYNILVIPVAVLLMLLILLAGADLDPMDTIPNMSPSDGAEYFLVVGLEAVSALVHAACAWRGLAALRGGRQAPRE